MNIMKVKFVHTNIVARDWKSLADFYVKVFGCKPKPPIRNLKGDWLDSATSIKGAAVHGVHLLLPGYGSDGPTLEIFEYERIIGWNAKTINRPGFAHIAFAVNNVARALEKVLSHGGGMAGKVVQTTIEGAGKIEFVYARDPEGNIIELQKWK
jgi:predicted enzyme related to lactoylglutathione lyase